MTKVVLKIEVIKVMSSEKEKQQQLVDFIAEYNRRQRIANEISAILKSYSVVPLKYLIPYLQVQFQKNKQLNNQT